MLCRPALFLALAPFALTPVNAQPSVSDRPAYLDPAQPQEVRIHDLIARLTLPEKAGLMKNGADAIPRLGILKYDWWSEALHGVARAGEATVFPQAIGLAAMWDEPFLQTVADCISTEARAKFHEDQRNQVYDRHHGLTFWSPNINIFRDPRWGRGQETYGEDPYLTSRLGVAFVRGMQGDDPRFLKTAACAKHFAVHSGPEPLRHEFDAVPPETDFRDTYLPAFEALVREARVESVMTAYNALYGKPCTLNPTLYGLLKEWGFDGHVVSDCGAVYDLFHSYKLARDAAEAEALAKTAGLCLTCGDESPALVDAVARGLITEDVINARLHDLLRTWFRLGFFDPPANVTYTQVPFSENNSPAHAQLALQAAEKSMVLLKNDGVLPLQRSKLRRVALIGPNADSVPVLVGNYNGTPSAPVTVRQGIVDTFGKEIEVKYVRGCDYVGTGAGWQPIPATALRYEVYGPLRGEFFSNRELKGEPVAHQWGGPVQLNWRQGNPFSEVPMEGFSARWRGELVAPLPGEYQIRITANGGVRLFLGNEAVIDAWEPGHKSQAITRVLREGESLPLRMEFVQQGGPAEISLEWRMPESKSGFAEAVQAAAESDLIVFAGGISATLEGEEMRVELEGFDGGDRTRIELPQIQRELIGQLRATGKPIVLVLMSGSAVALAEAADDSNAILQAWYPGQAGGTAVAHVLLGTHNPAGRLPVTFYRSTEDLPDFKDYSMANRTYRYFTGKTLFPFGHGLSYTTFKYSNLRVTPSSGGAARFTAKVDVSNVGGRDGDEVVQLYVQEPATAEHRAIKSLCGFQRVALKAGETKTVAFEVTEPALLRWSTQQKKRRVPAGAWQVLVGASSEDIRGSEPVTL